MITWDVPKAAKTTQAPIPVDTAYRTTGSVANPRTIGIETVTRENIHALNEAGMAPIHVALRSGEVEEFKRVVALGADPFQKSQPNSYGLLPTIPPKTPEDYIRLFKDGSWYKDREERSADLKILLAAAQESWMNRTIARAANSETRPQRGAPFISVPERAVASGPAL